MQANIYVYMKFIKYAVSLLNKAYQPIKDNASFFFFMYLIGILVSYAELPTNNPDAAVYSNLWLELFLDLYVICIILTLFPLKIRRWIRAFFVYHRLLYESYRPLLLGKVPINVESVNAPTCW